MCDQRRRREEDRNKESADERVAFKAVVCSSSPRGLGLAPPTPQEEEGRRWWSHQQGKTAPHQHCRAEEAKGARRPKEPRGARRPKEPKGVRSPRSEEQPGCRRETEQQRARAWFPEHSEQEVGEVGGLMASQL